MDDDSESEDHLVGEELGWEDEDGEDSGDDEGTNGSSVSGDDDDDDDASSGVDPTVEAEEEEGTPWVENIICKRTVWRRTDAEGRLVCFLCKRRFRSEDHIRDHERDSKFHNRKVEERFRSIETMVCSMRAKHLGLIECERDMIEDKRQRIRQQRYQPYYYDPPETKKQRTAKLPLLDFFIPAKALPCLGPNLMARIGSFTSFRGGLMDFCVSLGPMDATAIRHYYLHGNYRYLQHILTLYVSGAIKGRRCSEFIKAWMKANKEWKKFCTPENIDKFSTATTRDATTGVLTSNVDPAVLFNNPAVAIELDLDEVLEFLLQQDGVDVNGYTFNSYFMHSRPHLSAVALTGEALLSVEGINWNLPVYDSDSMRSNSDRFPSFDRLFELACKSHLGCFRLLVNSGKFNVNQPLNVGRGPLSLFPLTIVLLGLMKDHEVDIDELDLWWCRFRDLIKAGADPRLSEDSFMSPLNSAKHWRDYSSTGIHEQNFKALNEAIELMERLAKMLDEC